MDKQQLVQPNYYKGDGVDVIDMIEKLQGKQAAIEFCRGNVIKYVSRFDKKNGAEDLKKANTYIARLLQLTNTPTMNVPLRQQKSKRRTLRRLFNKWFGRKKEY